MKTIIIATVISTGLLWGCQDEPADQGQPQTKMDQKMTQGMDHDTNHDHDQMSKDSEGKMNHQQMSKTENIAYYTCPMESHKHISSDEPGSCPECGMALVAATEVSPDQADYFGCPMPSHSQIRADEAGQCPECGMNLKPYKLEKADS